MKKLLFLILAISSGQVSAWSASGAIEEITVCSAGVNESWARILQFKLEGKWFGTYADWYAPTASDYDDNIVTSLVLTAFSTNQIVSINANHAQLTYCGNVTSMLHTNAGDYIKITK